MEAIYVGIDVSKDRLDVHVRPSGEAFAVARDGQGLEELVARLSACSPTLIAVPTPWTRCSVSTPYR